MWNLLRSDLKEFASSIATDGNTIRENLETKLVSESSAQDDEHQTHTYGSSTDMIIGEDGEVAYVAEDDDDDDNDDNDNDNDLSVNDEVIDEALRRADDEETYITPLLGKEINGVNYCDPAAKHSHDKGVKLEEETETEAGAGGKHHAQEQDSQEGIDSTAPEEGRGPPAIDTDGWGDTGDPTFDDEEPTISTEDTMDVTSNLEIDRSDATETHAQDDPAVLAFLDSFSMAAKAQEIGEILAENSDTTGKHFDSLVPNAVTYEQFWQRYYFRCDPERIQREWDEEDTKVRKERQEMIDKGKQKVQNLFGGALKAIKGAASQDAGTAGTKEESIYEKYQAELVEKRRALQEGSAHSADSTSDVQVTKIGGIGGLFGRVRPPFVMNTAVDDEELENAAAQDEDSQSDDASEEEEEDDFGWGSDDDDDDDDNANDDDDDDNSSHSSEEDAKSEGTEEVVFSEHAGTSGSSELEKLRAELERTLMLKDELEQTLQQQDQQFQLHGDGTQAVATEDGSEVERLKLVLFENNSELAALKASMEDAKGENVEIDQLEIKVGEREAEIELMRLELVRKDEQYNELRQNLEKADVLQDEEDAKDDDMLAEALETINSLQAELEETKTVAGQEFEEMENRYKEEIVKLEILERVQKDEDEEDTKALNNATETIASLQCELDSSHASVSKLQKDLTTMKALDEEHVTKDQDALAAAFDNISSLQSELQDAKNKLTAATQTNLEKITNSSSELVNAGATISSLTSELEEVKARLTLKEDEDALDQSSLADAKETISTLNLELDRSQLEAASTKDDAKAEIQQGTEALEASQNKIVSLQSKLEAAQIEIVRIQKNNDEESSNSNDVRNDTNKALAAVQSELEMAKTKYATLQDQVALMKTSREKEISEIERAYAEANETILSLNEKLEESKANAEKQMIDVSAQYESSTMELREMKIQLESEVKNLFANICVLERGKENAENEARNLKKALQELEEEIKRNGQVASPSSPNQGSFSSGVDVQSPVSTEIKENRDVEEDGGWGEDWSDDEDDDL